MACIDRQASSLRHSSTVGVNVPSPVWVLLGVVAAKAQVKVLAHVAVDPAAHDEALAVVAGVLHVDHLVVVLMALGFRSTWTFQRDGPDQTRQKEKVQKRG